MKKILVVGLLLLGLTGPTMAQQACAPLNDMHKRLVHDFGQVPTWKGITQAGLLVLYQNDETMDWTLTIRKSQTPNDLCIVTQGAGGELSKGARVEEREALQ